MNQTKLHKKIILIGDGAVGASYAFALVMQGIGQELGIIDINIAKAEGDAIDLSHALAFTSPKKIYSATYSDVKDADLVVITSGAPQKVGETRIDLVEKNLRIMHDVIEQVMSNGFNGVFLIASNPVDILTYAAWRFSGLPKERVIGSGTSLDSARFRQALAEKINVDARSVHAYIMGEHGDSEFAVWSHANVGGMNLEDFLRTRRNFKEEDLVEVFLSVRDAAYRIIERKGSTYYGIAAALARITKAIFEDESTVLPLSVYLDGHFGGIKDVYVGAPAIIGARGVEQIVDIPLNDQEQQRMHASAHQLKTIVQELFSKKEFAEYCIHES